MSFPALQQFGEDPLLFEHEKAPVQIVRSIMVFPFWSWVTWLACREPWPNTCPSSLAKLTNSIAFTHIMNGILFSDLKANVQKEDVEIVVVSTLERRCVLEHWYFGLLWFTLHPGKKQCCAMCICSSLHLQIVWSVLYCLSDTLYTHKVHRFTLFFCKHAILGHCLIMSCIGFYSRMSTICSIWCAPRVLLPAPRSPPAATVTGLRRARSVPQWVNHALLMHFPSFHQQRFSFHHPVPCCNPHLPGVLKNVAPLFWDAPLNFKTYFFGYSPFKTLLVLPVVNIASPLQERAVMDSDSEMDPCLTTICIYNLCTGKLFGLVKD